MIRCKWLHQLHLIKGFLSSGNSFLRAHWWPLDPQSSRTLDATNPRAPCLPPQPELGNSGLEPAMLKGWPINTLVNGLVDALVNGLVNALVNELVNALVSHG